MSDYNYNNNNGNGDKWNDHLDLIARHYIEDHWNYDQIALVLTNIGLPTRGPTVKARLQNWKIRRFNREDENAILAKCLLHARTAGRQLSFQRFGEEYPLERVEGYIRRNPQIQPSDDKLPAHLKAIEGQSTTDGATGEDAGGVLEASSQTGQGSLSSDRQDAEAIRKKRKHATLTTWTRPIAHTRPSPSRSKEDSGTNGGVENDKKDEAAPNAKSAEAKLESIQKAITTIKELSGDLGLKDTDITEALHQPEKLRTLAKERTAQKQDEDKRTDLGPLHFAAFRNDVDVINALLKYHADVNARGGSGLTALHIAAGQDNFEALQALLVNDLLELNAVDDDGDTPLLHAINGESLQCALLLVHQGSDVDLYNPKGQTPLHYVCLEKNMKPLVEQILLRSKNLNQQDSEGHTPLHYAIYSKNWEYVEMLIKDGKADFNIQNMSGRTPMHAACFNAPPKILMLMLENEQVDCTIAGNEKETVLHLLCQRDICEVTQAVVSRPGVDVNAKRLDGTTPLLLAAFNGSYDTVNMLIENDANVKDHDADLDTALTMAIQTGNTRVAELLIEKGSPVNPQNKSPTRYRAELQSTRKAQEVSSALNGMDKRSRTPFTRSFARSQRGSGHAEPGRPASLHFTGMPGATPAQLQTVLNQLVDQAVIKLSAANNGAGALPGAGPNNIAVELMQTGLDANAAYTRAADTNMFMWHNTPDMFGGVVNDLPQTSNSVGGLWNTEGMEI